MVDVKKYIEENGKEFFSNIIKENKTVEMYLKLLNAGDDKEIDSILDDLSPELMRTVLRRFVLAFGREE